MTNQEQMFNWVNAILADNTIPQVEKLLRIQNIFVNSTIDAFFEPLDNPRNLKFHPQDSRIHELWKKYDQYLSNKVG